MRDMIIYLVTVFIVFFLGIKLGEQKKEIVRVPQIEYCVMSWWFSGNTLYWAFDGKFSSENWLQFQLDKKFPPTINQEPIERIWVFGDSVIVITKDKYWKLHCEGNPQDDWYVDDWKPLFN